tara:strand:+ start:336 stop:698 length:363 start_codon:yes stop_codon:yes gene_type:complete
MTLWNVGNDNTGVFCGIDRGLSLIMKNYFIYIITNYKKTTLYSGITNNLIRRMDEHKKGLLNGFSKKYNLKNLVYYEETNNVNDAIKREKQLKKWNRKWKEELINKVNPVWKDLSADWFD